MDAYGHAKALTGESFLACFLVLLVLLNLSFEFAHAANLCELNCVGKSLTQAARSFLLSLLPLLSLQSSRGTFGQISLNTVQVNETGPGEEGFLELGRLAADMTKGTHEEAKEWVGKVPGGNPHYSPETVDFLKKAGFVSLPVKAGDLVCFAGTLDHLSLSNRTEHERHTFQLHLVEGPDAGIHWATSNWMQYPEGLSFPKLS